MRSGGVSHSDKQTEQDYRPIVRGSAVGESQGIIPHDGYKRTWQLYAMLDRAKLIVERSLSKATLLSKGLR